MAINLTASKGSIEITLDNFAKTITYIPVTTTNSNITGEESLADGSSSSISGVLFKKEDVYSQETVALMENADAILLVKTSVTINKDDKIQYGGVTYRIQEVETRRSAEVDMYVLGRLFKI